MVEIRLLGAVEVRRDGARVRVASRRVRALLCLLALEAGQPVGVDVLARGIWDEDPPDNVRASVHTLMARLRRLVGDVVVTETAGYRLAVARESVDALRFRDGVARAVRGADPDVVRREIEAALEIWETPFGEAPSVFLARHDGARLVEERLRALEMRIDLDLSEQRYADCIGDLTSLVDDHPLRETVWVRLLRALIGAGRAAEALGRYESVRQLLADELGTDPGPELQELYETLLDGRPPEVSEARDSVPRQLPAGTTSFTGRVRELSWLHAAAEPLVVVHGQGGVGKTALVVEWAQQVVDEFPGGQFFVDLRGFGPGEPIGPEVALEFVLRSLQIPGERIPASLDQRAALLRSSFADRRALLILDNVRDAAQVRPLLPGGPSRVVVTSRSQLRSLAAREGAHRVALDRLPPADSTALLRQRLASPEGRIDDDLIAELAELCGHLPVALTVAAERFARLPADGLCEELEELRDQTRRLDALATGDDPLTDVRAVFDSTYRLLGSDAARLLRMLGVVPDTQVSLDAAAATGGVSPTAARRLLDELVECHLVDERAPRWYAVHDLVRAYAGRLVADDPERDDAQTRLRSWCVHVAERARRATRGRDTVLPLGALPSGLEVEDFADAGSAKTWFAEHRRLLSAVLDDAAADGDHDTVHRLAHGYAEFLYMVCADAEERAVRRLAVDAARAIGDAAAIGAALNDQGIRLGRDGLYTEALAAFREASEQFGCAGEVVGEHRARSNEAEVLKLDGWAAAAIVLLEQEASRLSELGLAEEHSSCVTSLAGAYVAAERFTDAVASATWAAAAHEERGAMSYAGHSLEALGAAQGGLGRLAESDAAYQRSIQIFRDLGDVSNVVRVLQDHGEVLRDHGQVDRARDRWLEALALLDRTNAAGDERGDALRGLLAALEPEPDVRESSP